MRFEGEPRHTKKDGEDRREYQKERDHYSDKGGHRQRSEANDPKHKEHWKKVDKEAKKACNKKGQGGVIIETICGEGARAPTRRLFFTPGVS